MWNPGLFLNRRSPGAQTEVDRTTEVDVVENRIIILLHGIRTFGDWQNRVSSILDNEIPGVQVHIYKYGYFSTFAFLIPMLRNLVIRRFRRYLKNRIPRSGQTRVDIVAHSFGTYVIARALSGLPPNERPKIHTLLLCGSVLKQLFPWDELVGPNLSVIRIINDCGTRDRWPVVAQLLVFGMGISGRRGFAGATGTAVGIVNRFFPVEHSGFFTDEFMKENWLPLFVGTEVPPGPELIPPASGLGAALEYYADPLKIGILIAPLALVGYFVMDARMDALTARAAQIEAETTAELERLNRQEEGQRRVDAEALRVLASAPPMTHQAAESVLFDAVSRELVGETAPSEAVQKAALRTLMSWVLAHRDDRRRWRPGGWGWTVDKDVKEWKQEDVPPAFSIDGRYALIRRESQYGEAYLLDNQTLEITRLEVSNPHPFPGYKANYKLNYGGFNNFGTKIFLSRWSMVEIYDKKGDVIDAFYVTLSKDPISFVGTMQKDSIMIVGDTTGYVLVSRRILKDKRRHDWRFIGSSRSTLIALRPNATDDAAILLHKKGQAYFWDGGERMIEIPHGAEVAFGEFQDGADENALVTVGRDGVAKLWEAKKGDIVHIRDFPGEEKPLVYGAFGEENKLLLTLTEHGAANFWDLDSGELVRTLSLPSN